MTLEEQLRQEREARIRAEGERDGFAKAMAILAQQLHGDPAANRRRAYDRERKARSSTGIPPESTGIDGAETLPLPPSPLPLSPPLDGSPPSSVPSSPSPLSSPQTSSLHPPTLNPGAEAPPRGQLALVPTAAGRRSRKRGKQGVDGVPDPRHRPLIDAIMAAHVAVCGGATYRFANGADAKTVTDLLADADTDEATRGDKAPAEVLRRWRIGLRWRWQNGHAPVTNLRTLHANWNACRNEATAPPSKPKGDSGPTRGMSDWDAYVAERGTEARVYTGQEITQEAFGNRGNDT